MSNLLILYEFDIPTVRLLQNDFYYLFESTEISYKYVKIYEMTSDDYLRSDIIIMIRPCDYLSYVVSSKANKDSKIVICYWDDDVLILPQNEGGFNPFRRKLIKRIIGNSNRLMSTNKLILDKYSELTIDKCGFLIGNLVSDSDFDKIPLEHSNTITKIVYAANAKHKDLFNKYIVPIMGNLFDKYGESISFDLVGVKPDVPNELLHYNINFIESMPLQEYRNHMLKEKYDIGIAPLEDDKFCNAKYYVKYIEYTIAGAVGVYSNCEPYIQIVANLGNGLLAENNPSEWEKAISLLIENSQLRKICLKNAICVLNSKCNKTSLYNTYLANIPELLNNHSVTIDNCNVMWLHIKSRLLETESTVKIFFWTLKSEGLTSVIVKMKSFIKHKNNK